MPKIVTMPHERTRTLIQTEEFLQSLRQEKSLPQELRDEAKRLLRHYPDADTVLSLGLFEERLASLSADDPRRELLIEFHLPVLASSIKLPA